MMIIWNAYLQMDESTLIYLQILQRVKDNLMCFFSPLTNFATDEKRSMIMVQSFLSTTPS